MDDNNQPPKKDKNSFERAVHKVRKHGLRNVILGRRRDNPDSSTTASIAEPASTRAETPVAVADSPEATKVATRAG